MPPRKRNKLQVKKEEDLFLTPPPSEQEEEDTKPKLELYLTPDNNSNNDDIKPFIQEQPQPQFIKPKEELPELQESPSNRGIKRLAEDESLEELELEPLIPLYYNDLELKQQQQQQQPTSYITEPVTSKPATTHRIVYWDPCVNLCITGAARKVYKLDDKWIKSLDRQNSANRDGYPCFLFSEHQVQQAAWCMRGGQDYFNAYVQMLHDRALKKKEKAGTGSPTKSTALNPKKAPIAFVPYFKLKKTPADHIDTTSTTRPVGYVEPTLNSLFTQEGEGGARGGGEGEGNESGGYGYLNTPSSSNISRGSGGYGASGSGSSGFGYLTNTAGAQFPGAGHTLNGVGNSNKNVAAGGGGGGGGGFGYLLGIE